MAGPASPTPPLEGLGLDLVEVERLRRAVSRRPEAFRGRVFTEAEWAYADTRPHDRFDVLAARFAAKEAVLKALGTGWGRGVAWRDVEVLGGGRSAPRLVLHGAAERIARERGVRVQVSLSHAGGMAGALAVAVPAAPGA